MKLKGLILTLLYSANIFAAQTFDILSANSAAFQPAGEIMAYAGANCPQGWLAADGAQISRTQYASLYANIGVTAGSGDGSTTFNKPDLRGQFLRGVITIGTFGGSGTVASNNATFTNHGLNRTGVKVRLLSGTLTGLTTATDYWAIYVDSNTLAFATSYANALAGTKIAISGTNSGVVQQWLDPDASTRVAQTTGGTGGAVVMSAEEDIFGSHTHNTNISLTQATTGGPSFNSVSNASGVISAASGGNETRGRNIFVTYCIRANDQIAQIPMLVGSISSTSQGTERVERIKFYTTAWGTVCSSSPCTIITSAAGQGITVTRASAGQYTINFPAGFYSAAPTCFVTGFSAVAPPVPIVGSSQTATAWPFTTSNSTTGAAMDSNGEILCMGPR